MKMDNNFNNQNQNDRQNGAGQDFPPQMTPQYGPVPPKQGTDVLGIVSLVTGILSLLSCCCTWLSIVFGIAAVVCAVLSRNQSANRKFSGMAVAGLVCGIIGLALGILGIVLTLVLGPNLGSDWTKYLEDMEQMLEEMEETLN